MRLEQYRPALGGRIAKKIRKAGKKKELSGSPYYLLASSKRFGTSSLL
jgi:hypothetical protein